MLSVRLPESAEARLATLANETGRTKSYYAIKAIEEYLDDLEDIYLAEKVLEKIRSGKEKIHSDEAVYRELGL